MPDSFNKYNIDKQFTEKAWKDMRGRLDEALPVKKSYFLSKWLSFAALFCLLSMGGYWFVLLKENKNLISHKSVIENQNPTIKNENSLQSKNSPTSVIPFYELIHSSVNTLKTKKELVENTSYKKEKNPISAVQLNHNTASNLTANKNHSVALLTSTQKIQNEVLINAHKPKNISPKIDYKNSEPKPTPRPDLNLIAHKNLVPINSFLDNPQNIRNSDDTQNTDNTHNTQFLTKKSPPINQSSTGLFKNRKLGTQKIEDEKLNPKTIQYGIKQGLSSNLTSESKIFAGTLVDFYFNQKWFIELAPTYQFGAINQKNEVQYDIVFVDPTVRENPASIEEPTPTYIHTKDTGFTNIKTNRHHIAAEFLIGYHLSPKIEALMGISSAKSFNHQSEKANLFNNAIQETEIYSNFNPMLYNSWSLAPKIALRFALKPKLSVETYYAHNLIPTVKKEFQIKNAVANYSNSNKYYSGSYGLGFVYKIN